MFVQNTETDFEMTISDSDCSMVSQSESETICEIELKDFRGEIYTNCFIREKSILLTAFFEIIFVDAQYHSNKNI